MKEFKEETPHNLRTELKELTPTELSTQLQTLVSTERKLTTSILWHLHEVERRRLHLDWAYPSLFEYCVSALGYSQSAAFRRISAMRLLKELPEIEESLNSGKLNLTQVTQAQEYFKREVKAGNVLAITEKQTLLRDLVGKSTRECDHVIAARNPELAIPQEKERVLSEELTEIRFVVSKTLMTKIKRLKNLKSHINPNPTYAELLEMLVDAELKRKECVTSKPTPRAPSLPAPSLRGAPAPEKNTKPNPRFISAQLKREIRIRDQRKCTYRDPFTGRVCGSTFQVQIDHVIPVAKHGKSASDNLRLLCAHHNRHEAGKHFGPELMAKFSK